LDNLKTDSDSKDYNPNLRTKSPLIPGGISPDDTSVFNRSNSLAPNTASGSGSSQIKKPQLAKSSFNFKNVLKENK
jgi:hypothetical protein